MFAITLAVGVALGALGTHYFFIRQVSALNNRFDHLQHLLLTPPALKQAMDLTLYELGTRIRPASHKPTASTAANEITRTKCRLRGHLTTTWIVMGKLQGQQCMVPEIEPFESVSWGVSMRRVCLAFVLGGSFSCAAQQPVHPSLTAEQQTIFDAAKKNFSEHHPELALEKMKQLHAMVPENPMITDGTAETAVTLGDDAYALSLLKPWTATHPEDSFALEWLVRAYAETGDAAERDKTIAAVLKLHETTTNEQFKRADRFVVERVKLANGYLDIYYAIVPFSLDHIYMLGRQVDANNALVRQITLESNDIDQVGFAKEHPDMVAKGMRRFSMDTYSASKAGPNGTATQTQGLIGFMDGQPSYDDTKAHMLKVASGDAPPAATRSGVPVPKSN